MNKQHSHTKTLLGLVSLGLTALTLSSACAADWPSLKGWGGTLSSEYNRGIDPNVKHDGKPAAFLQSAKGSAEGFGTLTQGFSAADYVGKRVQFKGFMKTQDASEGGAGIWLRVDGRKNPLAFDNMEKRRLTGTTDWTPVSIVVDVPAGSEAIFLGALISGTGRMWVSGLSFAVVDSSVPVTSAFKQSELSKQPVNLGFTE